MLEARNNFVEDLLGDIYDASHVVVCVLRTIIAGLKRKWKFYIQV